MKKTILAIAIMAVAMSVMPAAVGDPSADVGNDPNFNSNNNPNYNPAFWASWVLNLGYGIPDTAGFSELGMGSKWWNEDNSPNYGYSDFAPGHN